MHGDQGLQNKNPVSLFLDVHTGAKLTEESTIQDGQTARLAHFFKTEYAKLVGFVQKKVNSAATLDAEDFVQEVAVNLFQRADISGPIENLSAYVYRALQNEIVDFFRTRKRTVSLDQPVNGDENVRLADIIRDKSRSAVSELEKQDVIKTLYRHLDNLSENERALILATEIEGHTFRELSEKWQIPINTLLSRKSRAMKKLVRGIYG